MNRFTMILPIVLLAAHSGSAVAQTAPAVSVDHAWARASAGAVKTGAAYMTLVATGAPDRLVSAATPVCERAEVHETTNDNGVMKMRPVSGIALDPGTPVTLMPGGYHVMMTGLKAPLKSGSNFPLTLTFAHAAPITVTVTVVGAGATGAPAEVDHSKMKM